MLFFGVKTKEAIWLRLSGIPRILFQQLAEKWKAEGKDEPNTLDEIREWVSNPSLMIGKMPHQTTDL